MSTNKKQVFSQRVLYTPSSFARTSLLHLQETGTLQALYPHTSRRGGILSYLFFTVLSGEGKLQYEEREYDLCAGDCVFLDCQKEYAHSTGDVHQPEKAMWKLEWAHFYGPNMEEIYEKYSSRGGTPVFHPKDPDEYVQVLDKLYQIADSSSYVRDMEIHTNLSELLVLLMKDAWKEEADLPVLDGSPESGGMTERRTEARAAELQKVKEYLDEHFTEKVSLDELAARFYINKYYLMKIFKKRYGTTINDYVIACRITKAKQLLRFSSQTVEEISSECGMSSAAYLSRMFKKIEGVSPGEYRKMW